jgi:glutathione S-transferase
LGKSPVLEDNGYVLAESGAILEYLQETWDSGGLLKPQGLTTNCSTASGCTMPKAR